MARPRIALVLARGRNGVIGQDGGLPFRLKTDMAHFKAVTMGKPCLMGRRTWDSLGRPLPGRPNLVLTRDPGLQAKGAWVFTDLSVMLAAGLAMAEARAAEEVCIIGGGTLYSACLSVADRVYVTEVQHEPPGDVLFPHLFGDDWAEVSKRVVTAGPDDDHDFVVRVLDRRS
jgi:dihydrofolate reductase